MRLQIDLRQTVFSGLLPDKGQYFVFANKCAVHVFAQALRYGFVHGYSPVSTRSALADAAPRRFIFCGRRSRKTAK